MKAIMVVGTTSHAGKSLITTALCRLLHRKGWRVTPFKGQNMALNAYVTMTGGEIGFAQAVQAWAANVHPTVEMNPVLLKPQGDQTSQVIMKGQLLGLTKASDYYENYFETGWELVQDCLQKLGEKFDLIICEGAGSPAEINLKHRDLTNMKVAKYLQAPTILVVDIDRGGAFAHVVGTLALLEPDERDLVKGIIINKFRGQKSLLDSGIKWLEDYTKIPVLGVLPWLDNNTFPAEDSLDLLERRTSKSNFETTIAVIRLPRIANFTDFDSLESEPSVQLKYVKLNENLGYPDAVIIPGSKTTIADLLALQKSGMAQQIKDYIGGGGTVFGICGGFQMLGEYLADLDGLEGEIGEYSGLNLLPLKTIISQDKIVRQRTVTSEYPLSGFPVTGYEIHQGRTNFTKLKNSENRQNYYPLFDDLSLGIVNKNQSVWGCYLHGLFDNGSWRRHWLNVLRQRRGLISLPTGVPNYREQREVLFNSLADFIEQYIDLTPILKNWT
jgi:adenosylcobyric acid synthase